VPRNRPSASQLRLRLEADRDPPPKAVPTAALLDALAELLLAAIGAMPSTMVSEEVGDERQDRR
jgi:hypothetical protein